MGRGKLIPRRLRGCSLKFAPHIREGHIVIGHIICGLVEGLIFPDDKPNV